MVFNEDFFVSSGFLGVYLEGLVIILAFMTFVWILSLVRHNASIADPFWGIGFILVTGVYFLATNGLESRKLILTGLVLIWGLRLFIYLGLRSWNKPEDYRYQAFRKDYGEKRYWWISFFQVFMLQGFLLWMISAPLLAAQFYGSDRPLGWLDGLAVILWIVGFAFEAGGDYQLSRFRSDPNNQGKVLNTGFWRFTRHPNYFGDAVIWWSYGLFSISAGSLLPVLGSALMTYLLIKVSGVAMLERTLKKAKPAYKDYIQKTSAFFPWIPRK